MCRLLILQYWSLVPVPGGVVGEVVGLIVTAVVVAVGLTVGATVGGGGKGLPRTHSPSSQEYPFGHFEQALPTSYIVEPLKFPPIA